MSDVECPYCGAEQEICHDDGYGYDEDGDYEQECGECGKTFAFTTSIHFYYSAFCKPGDHDLVPLPGYTPPVSKCKRCEFFMRGG